MFGVIIDLNIVVYFVSLKVNRKYLLLNINQEINNKHVG